MTWIGSRGVSGIVGVDKYSLVDLSCRGYESCRRILASCVIRYSNPGRGRPIGTEPRPSRETQVVVENFLFLLPRIGKRKGVRSGASNLFFKRLQTQAVYGAPVGQDSTTGTDDNSS